MSQMAAAAGAPAELAPCPAHLQPGAAGELVEITAADLQQHTDRETQKLEERLARRRADDELITSLRRDGFTGARYEAFESELVAYGWAVLNGWLRRGYIFNLTARLHRPVTAGESIRTLLYEDADEREHLATGVVGVTMRPFREHALVGYGWRPDGGASLPTYFMNSVVRNFPNEYRRWHTLQVKWSKQFEVEGALGAAGSSQGVDPADTVSGRARVLADLGRLPDRERAVVAFHLDGFSHEEIMELTNAESVRAVEAVLYRWRVKEKGRFTRRGAGND